MEKSHQKLISQLLDAAKASGATDADAMLARGESTSVSVRHGKIESSERSEDFEIGLRVFFGQKTASISTSQLDESNIKELATRAVAMAKLAPEDPNVRLARVDELAKQIPAIDIFDPAIPSVNTLHHRATEVEAAALSVKGITNSDGGSASHSVVDVLLATSNGFLSGYKRSSHGISAVVISEKNGQMERDYDYSTAVFESDLDSVEKVGKNAANRTLKRLGASKAETGKFPVIYDRRVAPSLVRTMASEINGASVARGTSFLKDKMGKKIAADDLNFIDDPLRPRGMGSRPFDAEGFPVQKRTMVSNGVLNGWFLDLASANKLGLSSGGNAKRSLGSAPSPGSSNFYLENGENKLEDLISDVKSGLLITEMIGSSVDMITGDYSRGAGGFWISNGEIAQPISEATIAGNLKEMLLSVTRADDIDMRDSVASPSLRIDGMTVAGS